MREELERRFGPIPRLPMLPMDCDNCLHSTDEWREDKDLHCYMYRDKPTGKYCGHFLTRGLKEVTDGSTQDS